MKSHPYFLVLILLAASLFVSCSGSKEVATVVPLDSVSVLPPGGMIYTLPRTVLTVSIETEYTHTVPGPYSQFAKRFVGIDGVPEEVQSEWGIVSVDVTPQVEADPSALFAILPQDEYRVDFLTLSSVGLVIPSSAIDFRGSKQPNLPLKANVPSLHFNDLTPTPYISSQRTTHYSRVFQDSVFVRVPVHRDVIVERTQEEKAREAADFIFSLRRIRYELLSGDADFIAEGQAVEPVLAEINRLEEEYLTLFIGKHYTQRFVRNFDFTPKGDDSESSILCRFSRSKGLVPASDLSGSPVLISVAAAEQWGRLEVLTNLAMEDGEVQAEALYYRMPIAISVKVTHGQDEYFQRRLKSHQHGPLLRAPASMLVR